jgi:hypothetical protein
VLEVEDRDGVKLLYVHIDKNSLDTNAIALGKSVQMGQILGSIRPGTFTDTGDCGGTYQGDNTAHLHWTLPTNRALVVDGWTIQYPNNYLEKNGVRRSAGATFQSSNQPITEPGKTPNDNRVLFYTTGEGQGEAYRTDGQGNLSLLRPFTGWRTTWSAIIPGNFDGDNITDLLFYDASLGQGEIYRADGRGNLSLLRRFTGWRTTWSVIVPGNFDGDSITDLLFYDASLGQGEIYRTDGRGNLSLLRPFTGWRTTWSAIVPGNFDGDNITDLLFYDASLGQGEIYRTNGRGNLSLLRPFTGWRTTWSAIVPGNFDGDNITDLLFYDASLGQGEIYRTNGRGNLSLLRPFTGWRTTWSAIVPGNFDGDNITDLLFYDASLGQGEAYRTDGRGNLRLLRRFTGWRTTWSAIVFGTSSTLTMVKSINNQSPAMEMEVNETTGGLGSSFLFTARNVPADAQATISVLEPGASDFRTTSDVTILENGTVYFVVTIAATAAPGAYTVRITVDASQASQQPTIAQALVSLDQVITITADDPPVITTPPPDTPVITVLTTSTVYLPLVRR